MKDLSDVPVQQGDTSTTTRFPSSTSFHTNDNHDDGPSSENTNTSDTDDEAVAVPLAPSGASAAAAQRGPKYSWRTFSPDDTSCWHYWRWFMVGGGAYARQSEEDLVESLATLARCLSMIREYLELFGMPDKGGPKDQEMVLREVVRDLYSGGAPLWALEHVMQKAAEGLTGNPKVNWMLLPRKAFVYTHNEEGGTTRMFNIDRGFNMQKMDAMEVVAIRLASFASNTKSVSNVPTRFPSPEEFQTAQAVSIRSGPGASVSESEKDLAVEILSLASESQGLFYYVNSREYRHSTHESNLDDFWTVSQQERELFSRLACREALHLIDEIDANMKTLYAPWLIVCFRVAASAGACAFWFGGSWQDMIVAGLLAVVVAFIGENQILSKQEKIIYETVASFIVGLVSGLIALSFPGKTCFGAMAIAGVLDILQGFRVVYAVIEIMSKNTVSGGADFLEGMLFTALISSFLKIGQYASEFILGNTTSFSTCSNGINPLWFILLVPLAAISWSGLFTPVYRELIPMCFHGTLAYCVNYGLNAAGAGTSLNIFVAAFVVAFSAGVASRFTGRQAISNTVAGLYVLLPGAYLVKSLYSTQIDGSFFIDIIQQAIVIGIGAWTGSLLCSPTLLGTTRGLLSQQQSIHSDRSARTGGGTRNTLLIF